MCETAAVCVSTMRHADSASLWGALPTSTSGESRIFSVERTTHGRSLRARHNNDGVIKTGVTDGLARRFIAAVGRIAIRGELPRVGI